MVLLSRATAALQRMETADQEINFQTVAAEARVSTAWLYSQEELRLRVLRLRSSMSRVVPSVRVSQDRERISRQNIVATLRLRIKTLETKNRELTELLERAYGVMAETRACTCRVASEAPIAAKSPVLA